MKFLDFGGETANVKICAQFDYKDFTISASTIFTPYASVAILNNVGDIVESDIVSVEEAIRMIDRGEV